jgi:two-component system heavy metal sensor histidine kinase CusS
MFSKNGSVHASRGTTRRWPWSSITAKLVALYTLSASILLASGMMFLYRVLVRNLDVLAAQFAADEIHDIRAALQERPEDRQVLESQVNFERTDLYPGYLARVTDEQGHILIETRGMSDVVPESAFPQSGVGGATGSPGKWKSPDGKSYLLVSAWVPAGRARKQRRLVQLALDMTQEDAVIANFGREAAIVVALGILLSAVAGVTVARIGMRPLADITRATQSIHPAQLHERLDATQWPQELVSLASAFDEMLSRLEDSFARLSQFSADLAHELRTPINNLMGEVEVALSRDRSVDEYRRILESNLEECSRVSRLTERLLFLARAESPETTIRAKRFDARKEIDAVCGFHHAVAQEQGVDIVCRGNETLHADPVLFRQAISNLLSNALRYSPRGGKVIISITHDDHRWIEVAVSDSGSGIEPEHLPKLFDRFYCADRSRSRHPHGSGLGLAIVKSIVSLHGGEATVTSTVGKGTSVHLKFPVSPPSANIAQL